MVTVKAPPIRTNIWSMSVYSTARSPPSNVYTPVARITTNAPVHKSIPMRVWKMIPPAATVTEILVRTYPTMEITARYHRVAAE